MTGIGAHRCGRLLPLAVFARILFPATWILTPHCRLSPIAAKRRNAAMPDSGYEPARAVARHTRACAGHDGSSDFRWGWRLAGGLGAGLTGSRSPRIGGDQAPDCLEDLDGVQRYGAPRCAFH